MGYPAVVRGERIPVFFLISETVMAKKGAILVSEGSELSGTVY